MGCGTTIIVKSPFSFSIIHNKEQLIARAEEIVECSKKDNKLIFYMPLEFKYATKPEKIIEDYEQRWLKFADISKKQYNLDIEFVFINMQEIFTGTNEEIGKRVGRNTYSFFKLLENIPEKDLGKIFNKLFPELASIRKELKLDF